VLQVFVFDLGAKLQKIPRSKEFFTTFLSLAAKVLDTKQQVLFQLITYFFTLRTNILKIGITSKLVLLNRIFHHYELIRLMREDILVLPTDSFQLDEELAHHADDFEDALQYECAKAANCNVIITNNGKDFAEFCTLPFMTAAEFLDDWNS